ncbi:MAG: DUF4870 domain-containing protein [Candidatus Nanohalobium sp.]
MAALTHILGLFTGFLGPLVIYVTQDEEGFAKENARKALNWQISFTIYVIISMILSVVIIGMLILPVLGLLDLIFCVMAAIKASDGEAWDYPLTISLL